MFYMFQDMYYFLCNQRFMKTYSINEENDLLASEKGTSTAVNVP